MFDTTQIHSKSVEQSGMIRFVTFHKFFFWSLLGSLITIFLAIDSVNSILSFLFIFILVYPITIGFLLAKSPSWQEIPLQIRLPLIQQSFLLSWLATMMIPAGHLVTNSDFYSFIIVTTLLAAALGGFLLRYSWKLQAEMGKADELFP